ncbi:MAG: class I SAM-dependent methyltransferase [Geminicoccaceae bacterium]
MSGFDPSWLALREPYDHAVRDVDLTEAFAVALGPSPRLIDLGCGTGSNLRFLAPYLPPTQSWLCIDHDPVLLEQLEATKPEGVAVETRCMDLAARLDELPIEPGVGVTAAALLDLTSQSWLDQITERCRDVPVLMTLSVDGRMTWEPAHSLDEPIDAAFWRHQKMDKGFGPSSGGDASRYLGERLGALGHEVRFAKSDWVFSAEDRAILAPLLQGIAGAAIEVVSAREFGENLPIKSWLDHRLEDVRMGRLTMTVGHADLLGLPG